MFEDLKPHLRELRKRLCISLASLAVTFVVCFSFWKDIFVWAKAPLEQAFANGVSGKIVQITPIEMVYVGLEISFFSALALSSPIILWQTWLFVAPGLYKHEKKSGLVFTLFGSAMFLIGIVFSYYIALPFVIKYTLSFGNDVVEATISGLEYISFFVKFTVGFGISFEFPVISLFLGELGLITDKTLKDYYKYAIVLIFVLAAIVTPPDVLSQLLMAIPMVALYLVSYLMLRLTRKRDSQEG